MHVLLQALEAGSQSLGVQAFKAALCQEYYAHLCSQPLLGLPFLGQCI